MSGIFLSAVPRHLPNARITVEWFHIVQTFTRALDEVRRAEGRIKTLPKRLRWAVLKRGEAERLTTNQLKAIAELLEQGLDTATAWRVKERLRWVRLATTAQAARWRITRFLNYATELVGESKLLEPMRKALQTLETHAERVVRRWTSTYTQCPTGRPERPERPERPISGRPLPSPRIPQYRHLHHHDLHDR